MRATPLRTLTLADLERLTVAHGACRLLDPEPEGGAWSSAQRRRAARCRRRVRALVGRSGEWVCGTPGCVSPEHLGVVPRWQALDLDGIREHCTVLPRSGCWLVDSTPQGWTAEGAVWSEAQRHRAQRIRRRVRVLIDRPDAIWRCGAPCVCPEHATLSKADDAMCHVTWRLRGD